MTNFAVVALLMNAVVAVLCGSAAMAGWLSGGPWGWMAALAAANSLAIGVNLYASKRGL
jgi:hypothetical protein